MRKGLVVILVLLFSSVAMAQSLKDIQWITEDYPPYNFTEKGVLTGIAVDILLEIMKRNGTPIEPQDIKIYPWQRGVKTVKTKPGTCLFSTTLTRQRKNEFQWRFVYPIPLVSEVSDNHIIARKELNIKINSIEDLKKIDKFFGVVRGDIGASLLAGAGVSPDKMDKASDGKYLIKKLDKRRYDLISYGQGATKENMLEEGMDLNAYESIFVFPPQPLGYAFHKDTDKALLDKCQGILDELHGDGTVETIFKKYVK